MSDLHDPIFTNETKAREYLEAIRWPKGPVCPHCGVLEKASAVKGGREGLYFCNACRKQYTVTVGTVYERSKIALTKWLLATYLLSSSKKGMSAHQLHRMLGVTYKTAWFMAHRIREAMGESDPEPMGGKGKVVEADETYIGNSGYEFHNNKGWQMKRGTGDKKKVVTLVERGGRARSIMAEKLSAKTVRDHLVTNVDRNTNLMTDESNLYKGVGKEFKRHHTVNHKKGEYAKGFVTTNTVEGYFSIFKRGMIGTYQHCGEQHLQRYLNEFDFRYSNRKISDKERAVEAVKGAEGKRLMYRRSRLSA
jgi:transposase-like protein